MEYWDTSALLKLYVAESDSTGFLELAASKTEAIACSAITAVEMLCALHRKEHAGDVVAGSASAKYVRFLADIDAGRIVSIPYGGDVMREAANLIRLAFGQRRRILVRSLDAIHLATALAAGIRTVVAADRRLRELALHAQFRVLP